MLFYLLLLKINDYEFHNNATNAEEFYNIRSLHLSFLPFEL